MKLNGKKILSKTAAFIGHILLFLIAATCATIFTYKAMEYLVEKDEIYYENAAVQKCVTGGMTEDICRNKYRRGEL